MPMDLGQRLEAVGDHARSESFDVFRQFLEPAWIEAALKTTGTLSLRRRRLPAESAVWTVIGMALLRDRSIQEVVHHLGLVLPAEDQPATVTGSAILQARDRLGEEPLAAVFAQVADHWVDRSADQHRWRGLRGLRHRRHYSAHPGHAGKRGGLRQAEEWARSLRVPTAAPGGFDGPSLA